MERRRIPSADAEVRVFRCRPERQAAWWQTFDTLETDMISEYVYEVYIRSGKQRNNIAEFGTRSEAEKFAADVRDFLSTV